MYGTHVGWNSGPILVEKPMKKINVFGPNMCLRVPGVCRAWLGRQEAWLGGQEAWLAGRLAG